MKPYFEGIKVGDKIWTIKCGWAKVQRVCDSHVSYPIEVCEDVGLPIHAYTMDGKNLSSDVHQSAFWSDPKIVAPERPTPKTMDEEFDEMWANDPRYCNDLESKTRRVLRWILHRAMEGKK